MPIRYEPSLDLNADSFSILESNVDDINRNPLREADPDINFFANSKSTCRSDYFSEKTFNDRLSFNDALLSVFHLNIRSIPANLPSLELYLSSLRVNFDIIALTETWLSEHNHNVYRLPCYGMESRIRSDRIGGGVSLLIRESLRYRVRNDLCMMSEYLESVSVELTNLNRRVVVVAVYKPPGVNLNSFYDSMCTILNIIKHENKLAYILGDFNLDLLKCNDHLPTSEFYELMYSYSYLPTITKPTRVTADTATLIDNIFSNDSRVNEHRSGILYTDISDHFPIFSFNPNVSTSYSEHNEQPNAVQYHRAYSNHNMRNFTAALCSYDWSQVFSIDEPQVTYSTFNNALLSLYDHHFPLKQMVSRYKSRKPWLTQGLRHSIQLKNQLYIKYHKSPTDENATIYKNYKRQLKNLLNLAEKNHYDEMFRINKNNLKKSWGLLKEVLNHKPVSNVPDTFMIEDQITSDTKFIANKFNEQYLNAGPSLAANLPAPSRSHMSYMPLPNRDSIFLREVAPSEVRDIISSLKTSAAGWDGISTKILKKSSEALLPILVHIFNLSITNGVFPTELKRAKVTPIFKKGDPELLINYRPISVLPALSKILEKLVHNRLSSFLDKHNILYEKQFGFRPNHNTVSAVTYLTNEIIEQYENGQATLGVFIDLQKAFDTINHSILIDKLESYGIRGVALQWFRSYLRDRDQYVSCLGAESEAGTIACGVPQGSILGPLLFNIYINDIDHFSTGCSKILYADDTSLFLSGSDLDSLFNVMNIELEKLSAWLVSNKLSLNVQKTHYVLFRPGHINFHTCPDLFLNGSLLQRKFSTLFLGVKIDHKLIWDEHITYIKGKIARNIGVIGRAKHILREATLKTLYYALIYPYLTYCLEVWGSSAKTRLDSIYKLQKLACRIISNSPPRTTTLPLMQSLKILPLPDLYKYAVLCFMFRGQHGRLPPPTSRSIIRQDSRLHPMARRFDILHLPRFKHSLSCSSLLFNGPKFWNSILPSINVDCSFYTFKLKVKKFLFGHH